MTDKEEERKSEPEFKRSPEEQKRLDDWEALPAEQRKMLQDSLVGDVIGPDGKPIFGPSIFEDPAWAKYFEDDDDKPRDNDQS